MISTMEMRKACQHSKMCPKINFLWREPMLARMSSAECVNGSVVPRTNILRMKMRRMPSPTERRLRNPTQ
eukprot:3040010-Karenia_brevis.AAC.1